MKIKNILILSIIFFKTFICHSLTGIELIKALDSLEYFKYVDKCNLKILRKVIITNYENTNIISTEYDDSVTYPFCYRYYFCDGEDLFEGDGIIDYLKYAQTAFLKRGLKLIWSDEKSNFDKMWWDHRITVNGKEYIIYNEDCERFGAWSLAQLNFYNLLNDQLKLQNSNERVYAYSTGEEGFFIFLTRKQYDFITQNLYQGEKFSKYDKFYPIDEWFSIMEFDK